MSVWVALALLRINILAIKVLGNSGILVWVLVIVTGILIYKLIPDPKDPPQK